MNFFFANDLIILNQIVSKTIVFTAFKVDNLLSAIYIVWGPGLTVAS